MSASNPYSTLYETQGRFEQIRAYLAAGCSKEAATEATDGINIIADVLEAVGYVPHDVLGADVTDKLYEAQGALDQTRTYVEAGKVSHAITESEQQIMDIADTLDAVGYTPDVPSGACKI